MDSNETSVGTGYLVVQVTTASNAIPLYVKWCSSSGGTRHIVELTEEQKAAGRAVLQYDSGTHFIRVAFETAYGVVHTEMPENPVVTY